MITLILGGNRSGKTGFALTSLLQSPGPHKLLVTGKARDLAFREQIMTHKRERPTELAVIEVDLDLPLALDKATYALGSVLVDSLDF
ncbi:MAG: bifunctional adenosylcobinamide kinase/adenosylcobinamide-phosphate guanylyltransferase, partial [Proteobacteria bacterium]|nr:bifunctional adenosylcobinamide kinase/adenosylcobinamide-phosphate guanylyltransferase [Pseudomonadota bacterium]